MSNTNRVSGRIARLIPDKGFGFIRSDEDGVDYFFHQSEFLGERLFGSLEAGEVATFVPTYPPKGPRATEVEVPEVPAELRRKARSEY